jgi:pyruvate/2-oxoglutarate dehydrogenase complex dihydrolipoamide acyltransferase (E2) component
VPARPLHARRNGRVPARDGVIAAVERLCGELTLSSSRSRWRTEVGALARPGRLARVEEGGCSSGSRRTRRRWIERPEPASSGSSPRGSVVPVDGVLGELQPAEPTARAPRSAGLPPRRRRAGDRTGRGRAARASASPAARRLAERSASTSGVHGRAPRQDRRARPRRGPQPEWAGKTHPRRPTQEAVVRSIVASWQQIPHVQIGGELGL